jgi:hypothetical protein
LISIAAVVVLLIGGAAFAGVRMWNGSGPQPEEAVPASVAAFARLDLKPGLGQGMKVNDLLDKFPKRKDGVDTIEALKQELFDSVDIDDSDYRKHVEPWFADRFGVALWVDARKQPHPLVVAASDDDGAATKALTALQKDRRAERWGFVVQDGWALIVTGDGAQDAARDAAAEANTASLADAPEFRDALAKLPARQPVVGWLDLDRAVEAYTQAMHAMIEEYEGETPEEFAGMMDPFGSMATMKDLTGHLVLGAQATGNGVEVRLRGSGLNRSTSGTSGGDALSRLGEQPGNSSVAAVVGFPALGDETLGAFGGLLFGAPQLDQLPPEVAAELAKDPEYAKVRAQLDAVSKALRTLSGATVGLAVTDMNSPALRATADLANAAAAQELLDALGILGQSGPELDLSRDGNQVKLTTGAFAPEGRLSETAVYRETMADMPGDAVAAVYVDVQRLARQGGASEEERSDIEPLKSVGLVTGYDDGDTVAMLRFVIR